MFGFLKKNSAPSKGAVRADMGVYFLNEPERYARFKHACIGDYIQSGAKPTLSNCTCADFKKTRRPCVHMYRLALDSGVYDALFSGHEDLAERLESLSPSAFARFGRIIYGGYLENEQDLSDLGRFQKQIVAAGLISVVDENHFSISPDVLENQYFVIHHIMTDRRFEKYRNRG